MSGNVKGGDTRGVKHLSDLKVRRRANTLILEIADQTDDSPDRRAAYVLVNPVL